MENKMAIIFFSSKSKNTKKLLDSIKDVDLYNIIENINEIDFTNYDYIGFASGIYHWNFNKKILDLASKIKLKKDAKVFVVYTCGIENKRNIKKIKKIIDERKLNYIGQYSCLGFDEFGILKLIGGINKNHPNEKDIENFKNFIENIKTNI